MNKKIETFIKKLVHYVKYPFNKIGWLHEQLKQTDEFKLAEAKENPRNVYGVLSGWIMDVIGYGLLFTFTHIIVFGFQGILYSIALVFCYGIGRFLFLDTITGVKEAIKNG